MVETQQTRRARIRLGMVGGGTGALIGGVHRIAARMDDRYELVAGAFSSSAETSRRSCADLGVAPARCYETFKDMAKREARIKDGIEAVAIVTPNHLHYAAAREFLKRGIHVICDKPLTSTLADARKLVKAADRSDALFVLTHNYTGYPMVRQARAMLAAGAIGELRVVQIEYAQDWLTQAVETTGSKQAEWRTDPDRSGAGGAIGDIGTHAFNLAQFVTGLEVESLAADLHSFVEGRRLDDNGHILLRFTGGARGMLWSSQIAPGHQNGLRLRVYGSAAGIEWAQEDPDQLMLSPLGEPPRRLSRAGPGFDGIDGVRVPAGHPEGYLEGFANIYSDIADLIEAHRAGDRPDHLLPTVHDGLKGMQFIDACVRSSRRNAAWIGLQ